MSKHVTQALQDGISSVVASFGHKESGKSYSIFGQNNYQLERNLNEVAIEKSDDSRGLVMRCAHDILKKDPNASVSYAFFDLVLDNVRDILKYVKKEQKKALAQNQNLGMYDDQVNFRIIQQTNNNNNTDFNLVQAQNIEKEFLELHEKPGPQGSTQFYLKNLTTINGLKDLSDLAFIIEKGTDMSDQLNRKLNYTPALKFTQIFVFTVKGSKSSKEAQIVFIDLPDYDKLQTNIIDNQKLYDSILTNNTFNTLSSLINGWNTGLHGFYNAPYENSKLTRILQSLLKPKPSDTHLNFNFISCVWPAEAKYQEVVSTLKFVDRVKPLSEIMVKTEYQGEMSTNQEKIMQEISKENVEIKNKIDSFKREHNQKLQDLRVKLGLDIPIESVLKAKGNQKELQVVKEHKDALDKTDTYTKQNKELERKIELIKQELEDNDLSRKEIQESFSQKYYILQKKIDRLREDLKQSEMELDHTLRGQLAQRNDELQRILNNTHAMLIENSELVEQLNDTVIKKVQNGQGGMESKIINFMKEEGKQKAENKYHKLLSQQEQEFNSQLQKAKETQEYLLKKKEDDIQKAAADFKAFHDKIKEDQKRARTEIVKLYNIVRKQNQILTNVENGVYSQTAKKIKFSEQQKPKMPEQSKFKFLFKSVERMSQKGNLGTIAYSFITAPPYINTSLPNQVLQQQNSTLPDPNDAFLTKPVDSITNPEELRAYVLDLLQTLNQHYSQSHPQILKGENVDHILAETEKHRKAYELASKKNNDARIQIEAQRRMIERLQIEKAMVPGQPMISRQQYHQQQY